VLATLTQPTAPMQASVVHGLPSVQAMGVEMQPLWGRQASCVQASPSSQTSTASERQTPPRHPSPMVQALPSSHAPVWGTLLQPLAGLQESVVQASPSLQAMGVPVQLPAMHTSVTVQELPSWQG
jgi:hypothetical protein